MEEFVTFGPVLELDEVKELEIWLLEDLLWIEAFFDELFLHLGHFWS